MKDNTFLFNIVPSNFKLVFVMLFCLVALCSCSGGQAKQQPVVSPRPDPPVRISKPPQALVEDSLDPETKKRIIQHYWDYRFSGTPETHPLYVHVDDVSIKVYYGNYNGGIVVIMEYSYRSLNEKDESLQYIGGSKKQLEQETVIDGVTFRTLDDYNIFCWKEGQLYMLWVAYDLGLVTLEELREIADLNNEKFDEIFDGLVLLNLNAD